MAHAPFALYSRPTVNKKYPRYYVQFWDSERRAYLPGKSVAIIAEQLNLPAESINTSTKAGARQIVDEYIRRGLSICTQARPICVQEYLETFWDWEKSSYIKAKLARKSSSIGQAYAAACKSWAERYISPSLGQIKLRSLTVAQIEHWFITLRETSKLTNRTLNRVLQTLKVPLKEATRLGIIPKDPSAPILPLGEENPEKGILTNQEVRQLLAVQWDDQMAFTAFCLAIAGGLRLGEIQGLRAGFIKQDSILVAHSYSKKVGLKGTKTNKNRTIPLPEAVLKQLKELAAANPHGEDWVFWRPDTPGKPIYERRIEFGFYEALETIGVVDDPNEPPIPESRQGRRLSFHSLRHWFTATLHGILPDAKLRLLTGHSSEAMTARYDHITETDKTLLVKAQTERIASLFPESDTTPP